VGFGGRVIGAVGAVVLSVVPLPFAPAQSHGGSAECQASGLGASAGDTLHTTTTGLPARPGERSSGASSDTVTDQASFRVQRESFFASPTGTLLKSVAFPGWGQWSNGKKQKAGIYFGVEGYFITKSLIWRHRARQDADFATLSHARDRRNYFYWLTGLTVFISMFDAYADRYLLTLEQTRHRPDEFWGGQASSASDGWRLLLGWRF